MLFFPFFRNVTFSRPRKS